MRIAGYEPKIYRGSPVMMSVRIKTCKQCTEEYFVVESNAEENEIFCSKHCEWVWHSIWDGY